MTGAQSQSELVSSSTSSSLLKDGNEHGLVDDLNMSYSEDCISDQNELSLAKDPSNYSKIHPKIGMIFRSEEEAYNFYNSYAKRTGFSVRKGHVERRKDGSIRDRLLLCSNEGIRRVDPNYVRKKKAYGVERTNCMARIQIKIDHGNKWVVSKVILDHNHPLMSPDKSHLLRSHRKILPSQMALIDQLENAGMKPAQIFNYLAKLAQGAENVGYTLKDQTNYSSAKRMRELSKPELGSEDEEESSIFAYNRICQKAVDIAVKSTSSKETLKILESGLDKLAVEVEKALHDSIKDDATNNPLRADVNVILDDHITLTVKPPYAVKRTEREKSDSQFKVAVERRRKKRTKVTRESNDTNISDHMTSQEQGNDSLTRDNGVGALYDDISYQQRIIMPS